MKTKTFDCVELQHGGAKKIQEKLAGTTREERLEYWRSRTENLINRQVELQKKQEALDRSS